MPRRIRKPAYVCGPLTELPQKRQVRVKALYSKIGDLLEELTGVRAFVPHEHYDPVAHAHFIPRDIDAAERKQVCKGTSLLIVVAIVPSWGGGIEVEMANRSGVPVIVLCDRKKLDARKISRLLRGNPAIHAILSHKSDKELFSSLRNTISTDPTIRKAVMGRTMTRRISRKATTIRAKAA